MSYIVTPLLLLLMMMVTTTKMRTMVVTISMSPYL